MSPEDPIKPVVATATDHVVGGAVGVPGPEHHTVSGHGNGGGVAPSVDDAAAWYIAIVANNTERATARRLEAAGYTAYVATQSERRVWRNGRRANIERVVLPSLVFVRCTERQRRDIVAMQGINRFMTNRASDNTVSGHRPAATVPDAQIDTLRFMLGNSDTPVTFHHHYRPGDRVRVIRGALRGLEAEVLYATPSAPSSPTPTAPSPTTTAPSATPPAPAELIVRLDHLGCARLTISPLDLQPLP